MILLDILKIVETTALIIPEKYEITYIELGLIIYKLKNLLTENFNLSLGDRIVVILPNCLDFVASFFAVTTIGCIFAPINPQYTNKEISFYLEDLKPKLIITTSKYLNLNPSIKNFNINLITIESRKNDVSMNCINKNDFDDCQLDKFPCKETVALILYTSGTTGKPKAVPLTHENINISLDNIRRTYQLTSLDRSYLVMPLFHVHGLIGVLLSTLKSEGSIVIAEKFSASNFWKEYSENRCNWYSAVPTMHQVLLKYPSPPEKTEIRFIRSCSSSLSPNVFRQVEAKFQAPVLEAYAMTEAAHQMTSNPMPPSKRKAGSVGIPQGVKIKLLDNDGEEVEQGEVCIFGNNVTKGYIDNPKANEEAFTVGRYFRTGDVGYFDSEGYLFLIGRIKELINRGGEKISPLEVDNALLEHPKILEAISFAVPDEKYGQEVWASVVLKEHCKLEEEEVQAFCKQHLADFKIPKRIHFVGELPKSGTGKVQRKLVAEVFLKQKL